jgi:hypothetical protein
MRGPPIGIRATRRRFALVVKVKALRGLRETRGRRRTGGRGASEPTAFSLSELQSLDRRLRRSQPGPGQELLQGQEQEQFWVPE